MSAKPDLLYAALKAQVGRDGTIPDLWYNYLRGLGYSGAFPDMAARHAAALGVSVQSYYNTDGSLFAGVGGSITEFNPTAFTQSSTFSGLAATTTNMRDANGNGDTVTGAATNSEATPWIKADLGSAKEVCAITLGGGNIPGFGNSSIYLANVTASFIQYSTDDVTYVNHYRLDGISISDSASANRDTQLYVPPVSARYWRVRRTDTNYIATATFRLYGHDTALTQIVDPTYSQSSEWEAASIGDAANLNEIPHVNSTGAATANDAPGWIKADLGDTYDVAVVVFGSGSIGTFGGVSTYLQGATVEYSTDDISWTSAGTIKSSGISDSLATEIAHPINANARYIRLTKSGFVATTAFRVYVRL